MDGLGSAVQWIWIFQQIDARRAAARTTAAWKRVGAMNVCQSSQSFSQRQQRWQHRIAVVCPIPAVCARVVSNVTRYVAVHRFLSQFAWLAAIITRRHSSDLAQQHRTVSCVVIIRCFATTPRDRKRYTVSRVWRRTSDECWAGFETRRPVCRQTKRQQQQRHKEWRRQIINKSTRRHRSWGSPSDAKVFLDAAAVWWRHRGLCDGQLCERSLYTDIIHQWRTTVRRSDITRTSASHTSQPFTGKRYHLSSDSVWQRCDTRWYYCF